MAAHCTALFHATPTHLTRLALTRLALTPRPAICADNIVVFYLPKLLGSLSTSVLGNARQVFVILVSVAFIDHITSLHTLVGVGCFSLACSWYTFMVVQEKRAAAAAAAQASSASSQLPRVTNQQQPKSGGDVKEDSPLIAAPDARDKCGPSRV